MPVSILVSVRGLEKIAGKLAPEKVWAVFDKVLAEGANLLLNRIQDVAPVKTGRLVSSFTVTRKGEADYVIKSSASHAVFVEFGTRPHMIFPRTARVLRFDAGGRVVFTRYVRHPGTRPQRYVARAIAGFIPQLRELLRKVLRHV